MVGPYHALRALPVSPSPYTLPPHSPPPKGDSRDGICPTPSVTPEVSHRISLIWLDRCSHYKILQIRESGSWPTMGSSFHHGKVSRICSILDQDTAERTWNGLANFRCGPLPVLKSARAQTSLCDSNARGELHGWPWKVLYFMGQYCWTGGHETF
jgi:hypothetical protein